MCKYLRFTAVILLTLMMMTGCVSRMNFTDADMDIYEKIHKKYMNMNSYSAIVNLTVFSNKTQNSYRLTQYAKAPGLYRIEFTEPENTAGTVIVQNSGRVKIFAESGARSTMSPLVTDAAKDLSCLFVNNFFELFYKSEKTSINVLKTNEGRTTVLETDLIPPSASRCRAAVIIDNSTLEPISVTIYDLGGNTVTIAEFSEFKYNAEIHDEKFLIEE